MPINRLNGKSKISITQVNKKENKAAIFGQIYFFKNEVDFIKLKSV
jgi:hypothetical protein